MNKEFQDELNKIKERIRIQQISYDINKVIKIFATRLFGSEEDNKQLDFQIEKETEIETIARLNKEKGRVPYFNENLEPVSKEFGCPRCGGYVYARNNHLDYFPYGSNCESEGCSHEGKSIVYCPNIKCGFDSCESSTIPLGIIVDEESKYGYKKNDIVSIYYKNKIYSYIVISEYLTGGMLFELIRKFFDYNLTRKEMNEYILLESVNETNQN